MQDASISSDAHFAKWKAPASYVSKVPYTSLMAIPVVTKRSLASTASRFLLPTEMTKSNALDSLSFSIGAQDLLGPLDLHRIQLEVLS
jgi:hypothetical protein